jgi:hypothetical protein
LGDTLRLNDLLKINTNTCHKADFCYETKDLFLLNPVKAKGKRQRQKEKGKRKKAKGERKKAKGKLRGFLRVTPW